MLAVAGRLEDVAFGPVNGLGPGGCICGRRDGGPYWLPGATGESVSLGKRGGWAQTDLIEVTSHPRATADLQILDPRKPLPPATTSFCLAAVVDIAPTVALFVLLEYELLSTLLQRKAASVV